LNENGDTNLNWVYFIRTLLNECEFTYIWETENVNNTEWLKCVVKQRLLDQFVQNWQTSLSDSSKALNYKIFKTKFEFEEYFNILNICDAIRQCRFRTTIHYLPIETGKWRNIDREIRYCNLCNCQKLGDEYHYVLECCSLNDKRSSFFQNIL
jgi:hypothetical protein